MQTLERILTQINPVQTHILLKSFLDIFPSTAMSPWYAFIEYFIEFEFIYIL
jgi:hypothetical protein